MGWNENVINGLTTLGDEQQQSRVLLDQQDAVLHSSYRLAVDTTSQSLGAMLDAIGEYGVEIPADLAAVAILPEDATAIRTNVDAVAAATSPKIADAGEKWPTDAATAASLYLQADAPTYVTLRLFVSRNSPYRPTIVPWRENRWTYLDLNWYPALSVNGQWAIALTFRDTTQYAGGTLLSCEPENHSGFSVRRGRNADEYVIGWPSVDGNSDLNLTVGGLSLNQWHTLVLVCKGSATGDGTAWAFAPGSDRATVSQSGVGNFTPYDPAKVRIAACSYDYLAKPRAALWSLACAGLWNLDYGPFGGGETRGVETLDANAVAAMRSTLGSGPILYRRALREAIEAYSTVMDSAILGALLYPTPGSRYDWHYLDQRKNAPVYPITGTFAKGGWYAPGDETHNGQAVYRNTWAEPVRLWWDGAKWVISDSSEPGDTDCDMWVQEEPAEDFSASRFVPAGTETGVGQAVEPELKEVVSFFL